MYMQYAYNFINKIFYAKILKIVFDEKDIRELFCFAQTILETALEFKTFPIKSTLLY